MASFVVNYGDIIISIIITIFIGITTITITITITTIIIIIIIYWATITIMIIVFLVNSRITIGCQSIRHCWRTGQTLNRRENVWTARIQHVEPRETLYRVALDK